METDLGDFSIDPSILLPVELPAGEQDIYLENLSWEMIIAAMLKLLAWQKEYEHADYYRRFILAAKPTIVEELTYTGILKAQQNDFSLAEEIFLALAHLSPEEPTGWVNLALVYEQRADSYEKLEKEELVEEYRMKAVDIYEQIAGMDMEQADIHLNAGYFFLKIENFQKAEMHLKKYIGMSGDRKKSEQIRSVLARLDQQNRLDSLFKEAYDFIQLGQEEEGIRKIEEFIEHSPEVPNAWFILGWAYRRLGNYPEARDAFMKAIELEKPHTDVLNELAICLMELGDYPGSRKKLHQALQLEPENVKVISNLGILAMKENNNEEAIGFFKTVLEIDPEDAIALKYLDFLSPSG